MPRKRTRKHIGFGHLSGKVTREYERKGYSRKRASAIGHAIAGKIAGAKKLWSR